MEQRFKKVRKQLDDLGYMNVLIPDSIPLVEKLTADLIQTTESLQKYKRIAKNALEERNNLELGAEPYKCDNARLVKECNELHLAFLQFKEQNENLQKELKRKLTDSEKEQNKYYIECEKLKKRVRDIEFESAKKTDRLHSLHNKNQTSFKTVKSTPTIISKSKSTIPSRNFEQLSTTLAMADQKIAGLTKEIKKLKDEQLQLTEINESYKTQISNRDKEIERMTQMLEGGRPVMAVNKDCCYKDAEGKVYILQNEICTLETDKANLESQLKESIAKQHEAMKRALTLAERNRQLEQELRDIDQMALAVEADCNTAVKNNTEKVNRLQEKLHESVLQIQSLEREVNDLKRDKQELLSDVDAIKLEKKHLQSVLETALEEKKRLNDKINQFVVIEHDLNLEIDRLVQASSNQKRKIAELECRVLSGKYDAISDRSPIIDVQQEELGTVSKIKNKSQRKSRDKVTKHNSQSPINDKNRKNLKSKMPLQNKKCTKKNLSKSKTNKRSPTNSPVPNNSPQLSPVSSTKFSSANVLNKVYNTVTSDEKVNHCCCCCKTCSHNGQVQSQPSVDRLRTERDYYMKEYHRASDQIKTVPSKLDNSSDLLQKLNEKEQLIVTLQHENKILCQEKHNLMTQVETSRRSCDGDYDGFSIKSSIRRMERERDVCKGDIMRLEEERDALRQRLKVTMEGHVAERSRMEKSLMESEEQIRRLEQERHDLIQNQGSRRATINGLEEQCESLKEQFHIAQTDLNHQRALYSQLKSLHEQTDKALADTQGQLTQVEIELSKAQERIKMFEKGKQNEEIADLKKNIVTLRDNLLQMDREKDSLLISLDDKTERIVILEQELQRKNNSLLAAEGSAAELRKKLSKTMDDATSKEQLLKNHSLESLSLRQELDTISRVKENAIQENRRLQDELVSSSADCRCAKNEIELLKRQIEDLKRQLQHYVAEIKRFEDLMEHKEVERNELLDQFRSLSQEASLLETNNHSLENEATQSKVQLSVTLDHVADLENKIVDQEQMVSGYEKQITDLTTQVANLESKLLHYKQQQDHAESELISLRELCMKLDQQKDGLVRELHDKKDEKIQIDKDIVKLRRESETLQSTLSRERISLDNLEKLLAESRDETVKQQIYNQELEVELRTLKQKIEELQNKLSSTREQLDFYQERALDYSQQNKHLRREIANERFFRAKEDEGKRYPSL